MSNQLTKDEIIAMQKKISSMPNYAMWALFKAASHIAAEHDDSVAIKFMQKALSHYKENTEMSALDKKMNTALAKYLEGDDLETVNLFIQKRKNFIDELENGNAAISSAKKCLNSLDKIYGIRHKLIENEPNLKEEYQKLFNFAQDLVEMIKKY